MNCSEFESNALVREESFKCMSRLLENVSDLVGVDDRDRMRVIAEFHLSDQSSLAK
jgi:hypothetical protein